MYSIQSFGIRENEIEWWQLNDVHRANRSTFRWSIEYTKSEREKKHDHHMNYDDLLTNDQIHSMKICKLNWAAKRSIPYLEFLKRNKF